MIKIEEIFYEKIKNIISNWDAPQIYAISFFVESNEAYTYNGFDNVTEFLICYNTESDCNGAGEYDEERWNYAFWRQNTTPIVDTYEGTEETDLLFEWYKENNIHNIGFEDYSDGNYYNAKAPVGHYELLTIASNVAHRLQSEGVILNLFKKAIPIIVHGLEYALYDIEATKRANPNNEAKVFFEALEKLGFM